jgi:hypothetical protein
MDRLRRALANAPLDDEPVTAADVRAIASGLRALLAGRVVSHEQIRRDLELRGKELRPSSARARGRGRPLAARRSRSGR